MANRAVTWRAAWLVALAIVFVIWRAADREPPNVIQIEFAIAPEIFVGAEVVIDGEVVGTLARMGARTVNGFRVEDGEHTVEVRKAGYDSRPASVTSGFGGQRVLLMADVESTVSGEEQRGLLVLY